MDKDEAFKSLNSFIQGTSADITKKAMVNVYKEFKDKKLSSRLTLCVHDELIFNIKIGEESIALPIIKRCMEDAYEFKHLKLKVDFEVAEINSHGVSAWGEKVAWKS